MTPVDHICMLLVYSRSSTPASPLIGLPISAPMGERYAYPVPLYDPGFFEDFFDDKPKAVRTFWQVVNERLATVREVA